ncbi:MAG: class I SAM-dependent methyltransferase [Candidatus Kaelpia imicola]|nr:class I SAM-dependent methyltransferase [Candidatus Kaelpia imicola]
MLNYFKLTHNYWWIKIKYETALKTLKKLKMPEETLILDAGCGNGYFSNIALNYKKIIALDLKTMDNNTIENRVIANLTNLPFKKESFKIVVSFEVLEHIKDDKRALEEISRVLEKSGLLFGSLPMSPTLWGQQDKLNKHYRRYRKRELLDKLSKSGFSNTEVDLFGWTIFLAVYLFRKFQKILNIKKETDDCINLPDFLNNLSFFFIRWDLAFSKRFNIPFGVSSIFRARKS